MADEKKVEEKVAAPPQAPAQGVQDQKPPEPKVEAKAEEKPKPSGLDAYTVEQLREFYKQSPQMFEEAGIVQKKEEKAPEEKKTEPEKPQSAAPVVYAGKEIKLPTDVPVNREMVDAYFKHAQEMGHTPEQVQGAIDFQTKIARDELKREQDAVAAKHQETPAEVDARNVASLRAAWGQKYDENMEVARRAAVKYGDAELLEKLKTSDPVLVRHFHKLGAADAEDRTPGAPNRNGEETPNEAKTQKDLQRARYNHPTSQQMFLDEG